MTLSEDKSQTVHFSDESKFNLIRSDGRRYVGRGVTVGHRNLLKGALSLVEKALWFGG